MCDPEVNKSLSNTGAFAFYTPHDRKCKRWKELLMQLHIVLPMTWYQSRWWKRSNLSNWFKSSTKDWHRREEIFFNFSFIMCHRRLLKSYCNCYCCCWHLLAINSHFELGCQSSMTITHWKRRMGNALNPVCTNNKNNYRLGLNKTKTEQVTKEETPSVHHGNPPAA